jgi:hypothetical protein
MAGKPDQPTKPDPSPPAPEQPPKVEPYVGIFYLEGDVLRKQDPDRRV